LCAAIVADQLRQWDIAVHTGIGKTGVVGVLHSRSGHNGPSLALRADMDALPIVEADDTLAYRSQTAGVMHACGHDGHTTMLLGAARYLAQTRNFSGTVYFVFQPAEEVLGGAPAMLADGLFERFPTDRIFALHNAPDLPIGTFGWCMGPAMATTDRFEITVKGIGGHAAAPHLTIDPIFVASQIVLALQGLVSRNTDPLEAAVVSIGQISAGNVFNVIPQELYLQGTTRTFNPAIRDRLERSIGEVSRGIAAAQGASADIAYHRIMPVLVNPEAETRFAAEAAAAIVGEANVIAQKPMLASEDFAYMLKARPGAYLQIGQKQDGHTPAMVHNPRYDFNDAILPIGASYFSELVERSLPILGS
jgi:amidohydrolase